MSVAVAIFIFRRPLETKRVFEQIRLYKPSRLFVVADGPRSWMPEDIELTRSARAVTESIDWDCNVVRIYAEDNLGFQKRFHSGLDAVFQECDFSVILEDDCVPNQSFFTFCEILSTRLSEPDNVGIISGSNFSSVGALESYYSSRNSYIWGWATWRKVWQEFSQTETALPYSKSDLNRLNRTFSNSWERVFLKRLIKSLPVHQGWDVPFSVHLRLNNYLNVVPSLNMIDNIGLSGNGTNSFVDGWERTPMAANMEFPLTHPKSIKLNRKVEIRSWRRRGWHLVIFFSLRPRFLISRLLQEIKLWLKS